MHSNGGHGPTSVLTWVGHVQVIDHRTIRDPKTMSPIAEIAVLRQAGGPIHLASPGATDLICTRARHTEWVDPKQRRQLLADTCRSWLDAALRDGLPDDREQMQRLGFAMGWAGEIHEEQTSTRCAKAMWNCAGNLRAENLDSGIPSVTLIAERSSPSMTTLLNLLADCELLDQHRMA